MYPDPHSPSPSSSPPLPIPRHAPIPPHTPFQLRFPKPVESLLQPFDDFLIPFFQTRTTGPIHQCAMAITVFTAIETFLFLPACLYSLGFDEIGNLYTCVLLALSLLSQIPKKFMFRARPWMVGRALAIRKDMTSSFPSRAVVCAVVYTWLLGRGLQMAGVLERVQSGAFWAVILVVAALAAGARINVGAHYPSDTVFGFWLGVLVVVVGGWVDAAWNGVCAGGYWQGEGRRVSLKGVLGISAGALGMTVVSIRGFWVKCSYVYGLLMASMAFRGGVLCVGQTDGSVVAGVGRVIERGGWEKGVHMSAVFGGFLAFGIMTRGLQGKVRILTFAVIYIGTLMGIFYWRWDR